MPIHGVSDRDSVDPRFKNIGKLRKGGPKENGRVGKDLDHFRFTSTDPAVLNAFEKAYGVEPERLRIFFPFRTMEENFTSWRESYGQSGLCKERCDGNYIVDWIDGDRHYHGHRLCTKDCKDLDSTPGCPKCPLKPVGRLNVILEELWYAGQIGLVTVETHGWNDIGHIAGKLVQWEPLTGQPFVIWREREKVGAPINGKRAAVEKSLIKIELENERLIEMFHASQRRALAAVQEPALLEAGSDDDGYYENGAPDDEFLAEPELEVEIDLAYVPNWIDSDEKGLFPQLCLEARRLGYRTDESIKAAITAMVPDASERARLTYRSAWHILQEAERSKAEEAA